MGTGWVGFEIGGTEHEQFVNETGTGQFAFFRNRTGSNPIYFIRTNSCRSTDPFVFLFLILVNRPSAFCHMGSVTIKFKYRVITFFVNRPLALWFILNQRLQTTSLQPTESYVHCPAAITKFSATTKMQLQIYVQQQPRSKFSSVFTAGSNYKGHYRFL